MQGLQNWHRALVTPHRDYSPKGEVFLQTENDKLALKTSIGLFDLRKGS